MNKQQKLQLLNQGIANTEICRCFFTYDENYFYYYPNAVNEKFLLGQEEDDFLLDGYSIRKISHLKKVEIKDDKCNEINKLNGLTKQIVAPEVDISSWQTIFNSLKAFDTFVIIEEDDFSFSIGVIKKVLKNKVLLLNFDANGEWYNSCTEILYSKITCVKWNTRYALTWKKYLENQRNEKL